MAQNGVLPPPVAGKLQALTSLRFFAAALIVVYHSRGLGTPSGFADGFAWTQAVSFFFVLSGFILAHVYPP